jgi:PAS domain S-box-containing protein
LADAQSPTLNEADDLVAILDRVGDAFFALGPDWRFTAANAAAERHFGRRRHALMGRALWEVAPAVLDTDIHRRYEAAMRGTEQRFEAPSAFDSGRRIAVQAFPRARGLGVVFRDVTGERKLEADFEHEIERSRGQETLLKAVLASTDGVVYAKDPDGRYLLVSAGGARLAGRAEAEIVGRTDRDLFPPEVAEAFRANDLRAAEADAALRLDESFELGGREFHFRSTRAPLRGARGETTGVVGVALDVTELRRAKERLEVALAGADLGSWQLDLRTGTLEVDERWASMLGRRAGDVEPRLAAWEALLHPDDAARAAGALSGHLEGRSPSYECEHRLRHADGRWVWVLGRGRAVERDAAGRPLVVAGTHLDVSDRRRVEAALREGQARWRALVEAMPQLIWSCDASGRCDYLSRQWIEYTGAGADEHFGDGWLAAVHPEDRSRTELAWAAAVAGDAPYELEYRLRGFGGTYRWFKVRAAAARDADGAVLRWFGTSTDIDVHKRGEEELRASEAQYRALFETAGVGKAEIDPETGRYLRVNRTLCRITGRDAPGLLRLRFQDITHPDDRADDAGNFRRLVAGEIDTYEIEKRYLRPDGEEVWVGVTATASRDAAGRPHRVMSVVLDVTARRRAEERQRLLMREVDHRAKNALAVVQSVVRLTPADTPARFVSAVEGRVAALARAHTLLAHEGWAGADLAALVEQELAPYGDGGGARVHAAGPPVRVSPHAAQPLGMALHELATNAAKYGALSVPGGRLDVTWRLDEDGGLDLRWVESAGPPVSVPTRSGFGTMLIDASLRRQLGGTVDLEWNPAGLRVRLGVPQLNVLRGARERSPPPEPKFAGSDFRGARILVVEDNAMLALELERTLCGLGCAVAGSAATLPEALRLAEAAEADAAILDVDLQGHSVLPVAELLETRGVPVVFATGFDRPSMDGRWADAPCLLKPYGVDGLASALRVAFGH